MPAHSSGETPRASAELPPPPSASLTGLSVSQTSLMPPQPSSRSPFGGGCGL